MLCRWLLSVFWYPVIDSVFERWRELILIDKAKPQTVRLINLEAITSGPHKDFLYAICGGLVELIDSLTEKGTAVSGVVDGSQILPWNLMYRLDKQFKEPAESVPRKAQ